MNLYQTTRADRDLLLAGADLEAVLADRESERLERDDRDQARPGAGAVARLGQEVTMPSEIHRIPPDLV